MEILCKWGSGAAAALAGCLAPVVPLVTTAVAFVGADFLTGVAADRVAARRAGRPWRFESRKAWRTVRKLALTVTAIVMAWLLDCCVLGTGKLDLARIFAGFACGVELWSFLENASQLSDSPLFARLKRYIGRRMEEMDDRTGR